MSQWYLAQDQKTQGPYSIEALRDLVRNSRLQRSDLVRPADSENWVLAESVPELFSSSAITTGTSVPPVIDSAVTAHSPRPGPLPQHATDPLAPDVALPVALWNPNAAACWSLVFTPAFGAFLHARNWRALGKPAEATANLFWFWGTLGALALNLLLAVSNTQASDGFARALGIGLLVGWYATQGRRQAPYVETTFPDGYVRNSWAAPLGIGLVGIVGYLLLTFVVLTAADKPYPTQLAADVKKSILEEWHKQPELRDATIRDLTLVHQGGNIYRGFVNASVGGRPERLAVEVVVQWNQMSWKLEPVDP